MSREGWVAAGLEARLAARVARLGIADRQALESFVKSHPDGAEVLGRVHIAELRRFLAAPPQEL